MKRNFITDSALSLLSSSCLFSFNAIKNLKTWNDDATDNRYVNNVILNQKLDSYQKSLWAKQ